MRRLRVLVVDDSVVIRRLVSDALAGDPDVEVVGTAANGRLALAKIPTLQPDVLTLDIEMPDMDGLQTLAALRVTHPRLPVIMFSTLTERGAGATLDALALGASDYVAKPTATGDRASALEAVRAELLPKLRSLGPGPGAPPAAPAGREPVTGRPVATSAPRALRAPTGRVDVVAIGVSTGGPNALGEVVPRLGADLGVPVVLVQHMPPRFTTLLAERLDARSPLQVTEGATGAVVAPGQVLVAPGGEHMVVERGGDGVVRIRTHDGPPESSCRPAVDPLLRSVVAVYGGNVLTVILTGMGQDGWRGVEDVRAAGGQVIVQDEATSVVWGMPGIVARNGLADAVLPLDRIAGEITRRVGAGRPLAHATRRTP